MSTIIIMGVAAVIWTAVGLRCRTLRDQGKLN